MEKKILRPKKRGDYFRIKGRDHVYSANKVIRGRVFYFRDHELGELPVEESVDIELTEKASFRPFDLSKREERVMLRGKWIGTKGEEGQVTGFCSDSGCQWFAVVGKNLRVDAETLFYFSTFLYTGAPVGVEVEE